MTGPNDVSGKDSLACYSVHGEIKYFATHTLLCSACSLSANEQVEVAVKVFKVDSEQRSKVTTSRRFRFEAEMQMMCVNPCVMPILGFSADKEFALVTPFMANKTMESWLQDANLRQQLTARVRLQVCCSLPAHHSPLFLPLSELHAPCQPFVSQSGCMNMFGE